MTVRSQTRDAPALSLRAQFEPSTLDREKRTVEVTWTTGARVLRGFWDRFWEELSLDPQHVRLDRLNNGAPFLADHDGYRVVETPGVVERAWLTKGDDGKPVGRAKVRFIKPGVDPEADRLFEKIADGIVVNTSVGYRVHKFEKIEDAEDGIPVMRATDWTPHEISSVAIGADDGAGVRSGASRSEFNPCEVITRGEAPHEEKTMPEEVKPTAPTAQDDAARQAEIKAAAERAAADERSRVTEIQRIVRNAQLPETIAEKLVKDGTDLNSARALVLDELGKRTQQSPTAGHLRIEAGDDQRDKRIRGMSAWLFERSGKADMVEQAKGHKRFGRHFTGVTTDGGEFRGLSLVDLARECLEAAGVKTRGMDKMTMVGRAFTQRSAGGMQSTSDFATLFEVALHKMLLASYATAPDSWRRFCGTDTVPDFRPSYRYRTGSMGTLDRINESGEFKNKALPDGARSSIETDTRGNMIAVTRQTIINDDMGALANTATMFGRMGGLSIEVDVYNLLTANGGLGATFNGNPFFHSSNSNINTTGSALSVSGLDADRAVMRRQKDISGNEYLELRPAVLVVPVELYGEALVLNDAQFDNTANKLNVPNKVRGMFSDIVDTPRLTGTRRYLFADPSSGAVAIKVVFLEGSGEAPVLESQEGWRVDGTEWKLRMDFEVQFFDPKGALTNAGA